MLVLARTLTPQKKMEKGENESFKSQPSPFFKKKDPTLIKEITDEVALVIDNGSGDMAYANKGPANALGI